VRRILAPLVVSLLPPAVAMGAGESVLLIYDTTAEETADLADALVDAGMTVTYSHTSESAYDGTNPAPDVYDCVIHLNGTTYDVAYEMPASGQSTLVAYVEAGGCYIGTEWSAFEITKGRMTAMQDLILLDRTGYRDSSITLVDASGYSGHPVLAHVPSPFTYSGAIGTGTAMSFTPDPVEVLMEDSLGNPAVMVREHERGKVVFFHHSGNYMAWDTLADTNIQQLFVGAVEWGRREVSVLLIWDEQAAHFDDLYGALVGAGLAVTLSDTTESGYDGSNPNPDDYDVVVFMDGNPPAYQYDTPTSGQEALTDFVDAGGGFIHGAFATYEEAAYGHLVDMSDLLLINYSTLGYGFPTWTEEAAHSEHPILANVPSSFTLPKCHHAYGAAKTFGVDPVDTLMTHGSNLAVGTREFGDGRVVVLNQGENYYSVSGDDYDVLADPNVQQLYVDAAYWASGRCDADGDGALAEWCGGVDCDDQDAAYNPWADEYCDSEDTDCDGESWDDESVDAPTWYHDGDEDGYGDPDDWLVACSGPSGYVANDEDCDDERYESRPGATEYCNGHDDDCDDETDEDDAADATTWYLDGDGDG